MKTISILLTRYHDSLSTLFYYATGRGYTHSSIALSAQPEHYYSFNLRGFAEETKEKHRRRGVVDSCQYNLPVTDETYDRLKKQLQFFCENRHSFRYTKLGAIMSLLGLGFRWKNHYFCSQFVAEMLQKSGALSLKRSPHDYLPNHLQTILENQPCCVLVSNVV